MWGIIVKPENPEKCRHEFKSFIFTLILRELWISLLSPQGITRKVCNKKNTAEEMERNNVFATCYHHNRKLAP